MNDSRRQTADTTSPLAALEDRGAFIARHIGTSPADQAAMLSVLGQRSRATLMDAIVPAAIRRAAPLPLPAPMTEFESLARLKAIAAKNRVLTSMIGQGYYGTHTPGVIARNILEIPRGTPRTRRISRRFRKAGSRRSSISRRWFATSPEWRLRTPRCWTKQPPPPRR